MLNKTSIYLVTSLLLLGLIQFIDNKPSWIWGSMDVDETDIYYDFDIFNDKCETFCELIASKIGQYFTDSANAMIDELERNGIDLNSNGLDIFFVQFIQDIANFITSVASSGGLGEQTNVPPEYDLMLIETEVGEFIGNLTELIEFTVNQAKEIEFTIEEMESQIYLIDSLINNWTSIFNHDNRKELIDKMDNEYLQAMLVTLESASEEVGNQEGLFEKCHCRVYLFTLVKVIAFKLGNDLIFGSMLINLMTLMDDFSFKDGILNNLDIVIKVHNATSYFRDLSAKYVSSTKNTFSSYVMMRDILQSFIVTVQLLVSFNEKVSLANHLNTSRDKFLAERDLSLFIYIEDAVNEYRNDEVGESLFLGDEF